MHANMHTVTYMDICTATYSDAREAPVWLEMLLQLMQPELQRSWLVAWAAERGWVMGRGGWMADPVLRLHPLEL